VKLTPEQREFIWERDRRRCVWPHCLLFGKEVAHFHSTGMGGRESANDPANMGLMCFDHARISDGEYGSGGSAQYRQAHLNLLGAAYDETPQHRIAFERAEALTRHIAGRLSV